MYFRLNKTDIFFIIWSVMAGVGDSSDEDFGHPFKNYHHKVYYLLCKIKIIINNILKLATI